MLSDKSIPTLVRERANQQPDSPAYTFIDHTLDPAGTNRTLTWAEVDRRAQVVAAELLTSGSAGDRAAILAPQGLEYIVGVLGAMYAGFIAVPLSVPMHGTHDERVSRALTDCAASAILTTSAVVDDVLESAQSLAGLTPVVIEIDTLDLYTAPDTDFEEVSPTDTALLQYTSGSTREPAGVVVTHRNICANVEQVAADYFEDHGGETPPGTTFVSWLPLYHDMGLLLGITGGLTLNGPSVLMDPMAFLQKPARWMQQLASYPHTFTAAPNFAFELAARRTSDDDMAGFDLGGVHTILSGSERIHAATIRRFTERFARNNLPANAVAPSYGLAEAMVYAGSAPRANRPSITRFDYEKLAAGHAVPSQNDQACEHVSIGAPRACTVRIVDSETCTENPAGTIGEVWLHGPNIANGYWRKPRQTQHTFGGRIVDPSPGTPSQPWLRTGDLGVISEGELFIVGRIKDLLIVDGRNHYPDDIEATIQEITGGRTAALSVPSGESEDLVAMVEIKTDGSSHQVDPTAISGMKQKVTSAVSTVHGVRVTDLVPVPRGSLPITTSGKVRRSACVGLYQEDQLDRLDATA